MAIDKELAKQILSAKQPRHFLFAAGSTNQLRLGRSKFSGDDEKEVKQAAGSTKIVKGRAVLENVNDEQTLVFYLVTPDKTIQPKLKRALKENAGFNKPIELRTMEQFKDPDANQESANQKPVNQEPTDKEQDGQQNADPFQAQYEELAATLKDDFIALKQLNPDLAAKLESKYNDVAQTVEGGTRYKDAFKALGKIHEVSDKALGKVSKEQRAVAEKAAYKSLRDRLAVEVQKLRVLNPGVADKLRSYITDAEALVADHLPDAKKDYKGATKTLHKLEAFVAKGLSKVTDPEQKAAKEALVAAKKVPAEYEKLYRESRKILKNLINLFPDSRQVQTYGDRVAQAAGFARVYEFDKAIPQIHWVHSDILQLVEQHRQYVRKRDSLDAVLRNLQAATQPAFPPARLQHFQDYRASAEQFAADLNFNMASQGVTALENEARSALSERQTFLEAYRETAGLLRQAEGNLDDQKFSEMEASFVTAGDMFESGGSPSQSYDLITSVGAELRQALRAADVKKDSGKRVTEMTEGTTREARRLRYKLELDGARKALGVIGSHDAEAGKKLGERLAKVTEAQKKSLTKAEELFTPLLKDINATLAAVRKGMQEGDWDSPEDRTKTPPPPNLKEWTDNIDQNGVLNKVKVGKQLAQGGFGAICLLNPDDQHQGDPNIPPLVVKVPIKKTAEDIEKSLEDFRKEAEIYEKIGDHPNILKCLGVRKVGDTEGLVMEAVRGKTTDKFFADLRARAAEGELSEPEFWSTVQYTIGKTMSALAHMHKMGFAHNDIKPQNIMIDEVTGDVKVIDVGTANPLGEVVKGVDNPIFQAPEQLKRQGSSSQTDALPTGGVAYEAVTGQEFHFGDKTGMMSIHMSEIEETIKAFGDLRGDDAEEMAIGLAPENEVVRTVNERGEDDPDGNILLRDPSKSSARSAYTDFMNAIMHPDPAKRLSPQQALEHPFLRDAMMSEEQVRAVIQSAPKGKSIPGQEPERDLIDGMFTGDHPAIEPWTANVTKLKEAVKVDAATAPPDKLLTHRDALANQLQSLDAARVQVQRGMDGLTGLIANAREKNTELFLNDNKNLDTLKKLANEMDTLRPNAVQALRAFDVTISRSADTVASDIDPEHVAKRIIELQEKQRNIAEDVNTTINKPAPALFDHCRHLEQLQEQVETVQIHTAIERHLVFKLSHQKPTPPELKTIAQQLADHLRQLAPLVAQIKKARDDAAKLANERKRKVTAELLPQYESLKKAFTDERKTHQKLAKEYQAVVRAPRDTPDAMLAFEKARSDFEAAEDKYQARLRELRQTLATQQATVLKFQQALGNKAVPGLANPLKTLSTLYKNLDALKAKMNV